MVWGFTSQTKDWVDVGVVAATSEGNPASELFEVDLSVVVCVKPSEEGNHLLFRENATDGLKGLSKLGWQDGAVTLEVKVFENAFYGLAFIISAVSALTYLFENNGLKLLDACFGDGRLISLKAPSLVDDLDEVRFTLGGEHCI